jgi:protein SCO1
MTRRVPFGLVTRRVPFGLWLVVLFALGVLGALGVGAMLGRAGGDAQPLPYYVDETRTPKWLTAAEARTAHRVGEFALVDQSGRAVTRRAIDGKVYVASFFYTTCETLCPTVRSQLARVRDAFRDDTMVVILSHTVTPELDGVPALAHYATLNAVGDRWRLLTGTRSELERLAERDYFVELRDTTRNTLGALKHTETLVLVDSDGHIRGMYEGSLGFEVTQLIADARVLRRSVDSGRVRRLVMRIL